MFKRIVLSFIGTLALLGLLGFGVALAAHPDFTGEPPQEPVEEVNWFTVAAETLGLDEDALWEALDEGQSLAEISQAQGVDAQKTIDAIVAAEQEFTAGLVAEGELSQEEADEWLASLDEAARSFVEDTFEDTLESITVEPSP